jgi:urea transporter/murein DD-endopeptidase MepM/ murein hydrolase activator NlpD
MQKYKTLLLNAIKPYSAILFLNSQLAGVLLLAITFLNPSVAISGVLAVIFTIIFAEFLEFKEAYLTQGFYIYNSLLTGMGIGFIFEPSFLSIALIAISAVFTFMLAFMFNRLFSVYKIPILSLPFSIVTMFLYLASLKYSGLLSTLVHNASMYDIELPLVIGSFFKSLGTIFFLPNVLAGVLIALLIVYFSRITLIMALVGFYFGVLVHSYLIGSYQQALYDPYAFNYILVAIALCGVFLLPTIKNFFLALVGVAISVVLTDAIGVLFNYYAIPVFTLPFNITVIVFIFILSIIYYKEFNTEIKSTPEASLSNYLSKIFRFGEIITRISLPFSGKWSVYQAFDDEWTHQGHYKYAYDFVKKLDGKTYKNDGLYAKDYYAFGESILAPVSGYIVDMRQDLADNTIGEVDRVNNWGNYIIIKSDLGFFVEISHLMQYSISVNVGDYIQANSIIAKCGNSGYSPEPHIHIQVQDLGIIGSFTKKFIFSEYIQEERLLLNRVPKKDEIIHSVIHDRSISSRFIYILDDEFSYEVYEDGIKMGEINFSVKMNALGEFYLKDEADNQLFFYNDLKQFYFYNYIGDESHLKWLFILSPRIPFVNSQDIVFKDYLPVYLVKSKMQTLFIELASTLNKELYKMEVEYEFSKNTLHSKFGSVTIEPQHKAHTNILYNNIELRRI